MPDPIPAGTNSNEPAAAPASVLGNSDQPVVSKDSTVLDTAGAEAKAEADAESKRLLEADPTTLSQEEATKREGLVKQQEAAKAEEKAKGVPEKYDLKPPEGVTLNPERLEKVTAAFKANGFTNTQAQNMVNLFVEQSKVAQAQSEADMKAFHEASAKETMEALGANAKTELAYVAKVKNMFSPETVQILNDSGMGNIKSFIFDLAKIGRMFSEEKNVDTGNSSAAGAMGDPAKKLFPSASDSK